MKHILRTILVLSLLIGFSANTVTTVSAADKKEMTAAQKQKAKEKAKKQKAKEKAAAKRKKEQEKAKAQKQKAQAKAANEREKAQAQKAKEQAKTQAEREKVAAERQRVAAQRAAEAQKAEAERQAQEDQELAALRAPKVEENTKEKPDVISYFNLSPRLGYDAMFDNLKQFGEGSTAADAPLMNKKLTGGFGAGLEATYQLEVNHFLFETGLEFDFFNSKTTYGFAQQRVYDVIGKPYTQTHYFLTDNIAETRNIGMFQLPIMLGAQFSRYYFLVGARIGYAMPFGYKQKGTYDWVIQDDAYLHQYGGGVIDVPEVDKSSFKLNPLAVSACLELGLDLDEWMQQAPDEQKKVKVKPGERLPFGREHIHYRVALFADYELLNMNNSLATLPLTFTGNETKPTGANTVFGMNDAAAKMTNLFIGAKFTIQFEVPGKTPRQVPPQPSYLDLKVENEANAERLNATLEIVNTKTGRVVLKPMQMKNGQKAQKLAKGDYEIRLAMQDFYPATATFTIPSDGFLLDTTLQLRHRPIFNVRVRNAETGAALPAKVQVLRRGTTNELMALNTDTANGAASTMLQDTILYALHIDMVGYEPYDGIVTNIGDNMLVDMIPIKKGEVFILKNMFFATNKTKILPMSEPTMAELFGFLDRNPEVRIKIMGHTDSVGKDQANQILSEGRANAVRQELIERGIAADRIEAEGYGETRPIDTNDTDEGRQNNRRVEVEIL